MTAAQSIVSRTVDPLENAVVTIGQFQAGSAPNIIPDEALLTGTTRTFSNETRELVLERLQEIARGLEKMFKVEVNFRVTEGVPVVRMTSEVTEALVEAARKVVGDDRIHWLEPKMGAEDFAWYAEEIPGTFMRLGCRDEKRNIIHPAHSSRFDVDETALAVAVEIFTQAIRIT